MLSQKDAKMLNRPMTIDLKKIYCEEYLQSIEEKQFSKWVKNKLLNVFVILPFYFWIFIIVFIIMWIIVSYIIPDVSFADDSNYSIESINAPIPKFLYDNLLIECKEHKVKNIPHCLKTWLSIAYAESSMNIPTNYFWLMSKDKSIKSWVWKYKNYWYTAKEWGRFYWYDENTPAETRYCINENSSWTIWYCKNGRINFNYIFLNKELDVFIKNSL